MSKAHAKKFVDALEKDVALQKQFKGSWNQILKAAKRRGFKFTAKELNAHLAKRWQVRKPPDFSDPDTCTIA